MRKLFTLIALFASTFFFNASASSLGSWNAFLAYTEISKVVKGGSMVFVLASKGLYSYTPSDQSIATYDKTKTLSGSGISDIAWNNEAQKLLIMYEDYNIDLLSPNGDVKNISDYYSKTMTADKTVGDIHMDGHYAYIATGFGVMKLDMQTAAISETYNLGLKVNSVTTNGNTIYAATTSGVYKANMADNLSDKSYWKLFCDKSFTHILCYDTYIIGTNSGELNTIDNNGNYSKPFNTPWFTSIVCVDNRIICYGGSHSYIIKSFSSRKDISIHLYGATYNSADDSYWIGLSDGTLANASISDSGDMTYNVSQIKPDGPKYNYFGFMRYAYELLYTAGGNGSPERPACVQVLDGNKEWQIYQDDFASALNYNYNGAYSIDADPKDKTHVMVGMQTGLYEFNNGQLTNKYNIDNSPLEYAATVGNEKNYRNYTLVTSVKYDSDGKLWLTNSIAKDASLFEFQDGTWTSHHKSELINSEKYSFDTMSDIMFDNLRDLMWFCSSDWRKPALICYQPSTDAIKVYDNLTNQDGTTFTAQYMKAATEDSEGNIWVATAAGPVVLTAEAISSGDEYFTQVKIPRNDGTNYADYLLSGVRITAIAIDGAGRKWFGTENNGVYLISADNMTQEQHFTAENSPLLSNNVESIAVNSLTGEVFFGTDEGLCSYMGDASQPAEEMTKDNVYAYPNPVKPDYTGLITVTGLTLNADIKIVTSNGVLVREGRSNGGTFTWDGCDSKGKRVASGVYMVQTATSEGSKGTVCKIAVIN